MLPDDFAEAVPVPGIIPAGRLDHLYRPALRTGPLDERAGRGIRQHRQHRPNAVLPQSGGEAQDSRFGPPTGPGAMACSTGALPAGHKSGFMPETYPLSQCNTKTSVFGGMALSLPLHKGSPSPSAGRSGAPPDYLRFNEGTDAGPTGSKG